MTHVWNERCAVLYARTYQVLYDAGNDEKLAEALAAERVLAPHRVQRAETGAHVLHRGREPRWQVKPLHCNYIAAVVEPQNRPARGVLASRML
jgi:hypothetical protein